MGIKRVGRSAKHNGRVAVFIYNGIGNFVQMTPALQAIAQHYGCQLDLVADPEFNDARFQAYAEIARGWPLFHQVVEYGPKFKKETYQDYFLGEHSQKYPAWAWGAEKTKYKEFLKLHWGMSRLHEVEYWMEMVRMREYSGPTPYKVVPVPDLTKPEIESGKMNVAFVNSYFQEKAMQWSRKAWPHFGPLADLVRWFFGANIHLVGWGANDEAWADRLAASKSFVRNWVGKLQIMEEIYLLSQMDLVVSTDTGLMHLADALPRPKLVALFGGTLVSKNGPWNRFKARVVRAPVQCVGCQSSVPIWKQCGDVFGQNPDRGWPCMQALEPTLVMDAIRELCVKGN